VSTDAKQKSKAKAPKILSDKLPEPSIVENGVSSLPANKIQQAYFADAFSVLSCLSLCAAAVYPVVSASSPYFLFSCMSTAFELIPQLDSASSLCLHSLGC
jgi:hypothetical protein